MKKKNTNPGFSIDKKGADNMQKDKKMSANGKPLPSDKKAVDKKAVDKKAVDKKAVDKKAATGKKKSCK